MHHQGHRVSIQVAHDGVRLQAHDSETPRPLRVNINGSTAALPVGTYREFPRSPNAQNDNIKP